MSRTGQLITLLLLYLSWRLFGSGMGLSENILRFFFQFDCIWTVLKSYRTVTIGGFHQIKTFLDVVRQKDDSLWRSNESNDYSDLNFDVKLISFVVLTSLHTEDFNIVLNSCNSAPSFLYPSIVLGVASIFKVTLKTCSFAVNRLRISLSPPPSLIWIAFWIIIVKRISAWWDTGSECSQSNASLIIFGYKHDKLPNLFNSKL